MPVTRLRNANRIMRSPQHVELTPSEGVNGTKSLRWIRSCDACRHQFEYFDRAWRCFCGGILSINDIVPFDEPGPDCGIWRYRMNLPHASVTDRVSLGEGMTPLVRVPKIPGDVRAKLEFTCPTGSFKDRGNSIVVTRLKQIGISRVV